MNSLHYFRNSKISSLFSKIAFKLFYICTEKFHFSFEKEP